ncbi:hypothetical protein [Arenicella xantha]|uniref:Alpha/beta hydrolase family protein DUF900 n=1 Tax=Arenicella xantha TaxID=644221 RepID=A0A395JQF0_9GAMM|nr:hypothetical protein [Arenicella xantha]RBP53767.1 hypothetical protein DFR28_1011156 [Arenicella xantha]
MKTKVLIVLSALLFSVAAQATLGGKNVILVHGFQPTDLKSNPNASAQQNNANAYWQAYWQNRAERSLYWPSTGRVTGNIKDTIESQIKSLEAARTCANGCVFVTHSTGDLVLRDALTRLGQWGVNQNNFKVIAVLDFAGAGGGTELADVAVNIANGSGVVNAVQKAAIRTFLGFDPTPAALGVLNDLRPAAARNIARSNNAVPRLRFVGEGTEYLGATKAFIKGSDDSVVPMHSACGASSSSAYDSCSRSVRVNGQVRSANGPSSLFYNHYAVLMGESTAHSEAISNARSGDFTTVTNNTTKGVKVDFATSTGKTWWSWWYKVRSVKNGSSKSMSANVYDTLNN